MPYPKGLNAYNYDLYVIRIDEAKKFCERISASSFVNAEKIRQRLEVSDERIFYADSKEFALDIEGLKFKEVKSLLDGHFDTHRPLSEKLTMVYTVKGKKGTYDKLRLVYPNDRYMMGGIKKYLGSYNIKVVDALRPGRPRYQFSFIGEFNENLLFSLR